MASWIYQLLFWWYKISQLVGQKSLPTLVLLSSFKNFKVLRDGHVYFVYWFCSSLLAFCAVILFRDELLTSKSLFFRGPIGKVEGNTPRLPLNVQKVTGAGTRQGNFSCAVKCAISCTACWGEWYNEKICLMNRIGRRCALLILLQRNAE